MKQKIDFPEHINEEETIIIAMGIDTNGKENSQKAIDFYSKIPKKNYKFSLCVTDIKNRSDIAGVFDKINLFHQDKISLLIFYIAFDAIEDDGLYFFNMHGFVPETPSSTSMLIAVLFDFFNFFSIEKIYCIFDTPANVEKIRENEIVNSKDSIILYDTKFFDVFYNLKKEAEFRDEALSLLMAKKRDCFFKSIPKGVLYKIAEYIIEYEINPHITSK